MACGETVNVIRRAPGQLDRLCTCGRQAKVCPVWGPLLASPEKLGGWTHSDLDMALLEGIQASKRVMIDSSKTAGGTFRSPFRLRRQIGKDFQLVHLVRDPRAVCWSIVKRRSRVAARGGVQLNPWLLCIHGAVGWLIANLKCELFGWRYPKQYRRVRYEDLSRAPYETLSKLFADFLPEEPFDIVEANAADNRHQLFGNRARHEQVSFAGVHEDTEWRDAMPAAYGLLVTTLGALLCARYGYTNLSR